MKDRMYADHLLSMDYDACMATLEEKFSSQVLQTKRNLDCFAPGGKNVNYGPELVKFDMDARGAFIYMKTLKDPVNDLMVQYLSNQEARLPEKCAVEIRREMAAMKTPDPDSLLKILAVQIH